MNNYQQAKTQKPEDEHAGYGKACRRREAKRDAERIDEIIPAPAENKKQVKRGEEENWSEKRPGDADKSVLSYFHGPAITRAF